MSENITLQLKKTNVQELHLTRSKEKLDTNESAFFFFIAFVIP